MTGILPNPIGHNPDWSQIHQNPSKKKKEDSFDHLDMRTRITILAKSSIEQIRTFFGSRRAGRLLNELKASEKTLRNQDKLLLPLDKEFTPARYKQLKFAVEFASNLGLADLTPQKKLNPKKANLLINLSDWAIRDEANFQTTLNRLLLVQDSPKKFTKVQAKALQTILNAHHANLSITYQKYRQVLSRHLSNSQKVWKGAQHDKGLKKAHYNFINELYSLQADLSNHTKLNKALENYH